MRAFPSIRTFFLFSDQNTYVKGMITSSIHISKNFNLVRNYSNDRQKHDERTTATRIKWYQLFRLFFEFLNLSFQYKNAEVAFGGHHLAYIQRKYAIKYYYYHYYYKLMMRQMKIENLYCSGDI